MNKKISIELHLISKDTWLYMPLNPIIPIYLYLLEGILGCNVQWVIN